MDHKCPLPALRHLCEAAAGHPAVAPGQSETILEQLSEIVMRLHYSAGRITDPAVARRMRTCADELYAICAELRRTQE